MGRRIAIYIAALAFLSFYNSFIPQAGAQNQKLTIGPEKKASQMRQKMQGRPMQQFIKQGSPWKGKHVFNNPKLGANGKSCATCHPDQGEKIMQNQAFSLHLPAFVQYCYQNALQGKGVIANDKLDNILSFLLSKAKARVREKEQSGATKTEDTAETETEDEETW